MIRLQNTSFDRWQENIERGMSARVNQPSRLHDQGLLTNLTGALEDDQISCVHQRHDLVCVKTKAVTLFIYLNLRSVANLSANQD